jgi:hypothetical protein
MHRVALLAALLPVLCVPHLHADPSDATRQPGKEPSMNASPFVGAWIANISKSKQDPKYPFQSATLEITVGDDTVTLGSRVVRPSGQEQKVAETFRTDGTETLGALTPGLTHVARWVGPQVLVLTAHKDGQVIGLQTFQVSGDGKTLTSRLSGMAETVIVFDRK